MKTWNTIKNQWPNPPGDDFGAGGLCRQAGNTQTDRQRLGEMVFENKYITKKTNKKQSCVFLQVESDINE